MRSRPCLFLILFCFFPFGMLLAQTTVHSTFLNRPTQPPLYSDPLNWSPAEVPNNTAEKQFDVTIGPTYFVGVDVDVTISNLTLPSSLPGLYFEGNFTVTGATVNQMALGSLNVSSADGAPATFNAGLLSTFSNGVLRGKYRIYAFEGAATLQFRGANIEALSDGELTLSGAMARVVDENGHNALANLARIDATATLSLAGQSMVTNVPFQNQGSLTLSGGGGTPTIFTALAGLTNFDPATRTITGGSFGVAGGDPWLGPYELRFNGADIVNLGSSITLSGSAARIADLAGNDGLRNFARILPGGSFGLYQRDFVVGGVFQNDGALSLGGQSVFTVLGSLTNFDASTHTFTGGNFALTEDARLKFAGADIVHNAASITLSGSAKITDLAGNDSLLNFRDNLSGGRFVLGHHAQFTAPGDFTNAGQVETFPFIMRTREILPAGRFTVPGGFRYIQTAGETINNGLLIAEQVDLLGGTFVSGRGTVQGDMLVKNATLISSDAATFQGNLTFSPESHFQYKSSSATPREISGKVTLAGTLEVDIPSEQFVASNAVLAVLRSAAPLTGTFSNAPNGARIPTLDGKGSVEVYYDTRAVYVTRYHAEPPPAQLLNISSRGFLSRSADDPAGDRSVLIGGFIVVGSFESKEVVLRGLGPSLSGFGPNAVLADPVLELRSANGALLATNDNWADTQSAAISSSGLAPGNEREAAIRITLQPGSYTVVLKEKTGLGGNGVVEIYDISNSAISKLANISTRGITDSSNLLIGGMIAGGDGQANAEVVVRALGPHMKTIGVANAIDDPTLEVRDNNGVIVAYNDDWAANSEQLSFTGLTPLNNKESAMRLSLPRGNYTAIVRAKGDSGGVALVEFYDLRR